MNGFINFFAILVILGICGAMYLGYGLGVEPFGCILIIIVFVVMYIKIRNLLLS